MSNFGISIVKWDDDSNLLETVSLCVLLNLITSYVFLLCEPGTQMTARFEAFSGEVGQCVWYLLPIELQRMYMTFLSNAQNPVKMCSYGGITCERDTSKKVSQSMLQCV